MVKKAAIYTVTTIGDEQKNYHARMRNYSVIMGLRFVCIALALLIPLPWNIIPILFAVLSPWFAVIIANNKKPTISKVERPFKQVEK